VVRKHPALTEQILSRVGCFRRIVDVAKSHHERLDGRGYHQGLNAPDLSMGARVLCVADVFDALRASRPYRAALSSEQALTIMSRDVGAAFDPDCFSALCATCGGMEAAEGAAVPPAHIVPALAQDRHQAA
jgi:HD-GYP domain-containing protein (c-di-GMP phosphodiesterase class II)